jgi:hypothetical protein
MVIISYAIQFRQYIKMLRILQSTGNPYVLNFHATSMKIMALGQNNSKGEKPSKFRCYSPFIR